MTLDKSKSCSNVWQFGHKQSLTISEWVVSVLREWRHCVGCVKICLRSWYFNF